MKALKIIGFTVLGLVALWLLLAATQPTKFSYQSSANINAPKEVVFSKVNNLKAWEQWGPWAQMDSTMKVTYGEKTEGVGATYAWTGKETGNGKMTVTESTAPTDLKLDLEFDGQGGNTSYFKLEDGEGGSTKTTWGMDMSMPFPMNAMMVFMGGYMEKEMNKMYEMGLANLKTLSEKEADAAPASVNFNIQTVDYPGKSFLGIRDKVKISEKTMQDFFTKNFGAIMGVVQSKKLQMDGAPTGVYFVWDPAKGETDMAAAIPVKDAAKGAGGNIKVIQQPAGKALLIDFLGSYSGMENAHAAMDAYMKEKGLKQKAPVIEEYVSDPGTEPDSSKWLTKIYYFYE